MSSSNTSSASPNFQKGKKELEAQYMAELDTIYQHKFSWLDDTIDVREECPMCILYKNSPCFPDFQEFNDLDDKKLLINDKTSIEYKVIEKKVDLAWDKLMKCAVPKQEMFIERQSELKDYMKEMKVKEKEIVERLDDLEQQQQQSQH
ncbi:hypothetical protein ABK040_007633 [Willaertia magna]